MEKVFFDLPIQNDEETYEQIIEMERNNDYTTGNLLDYEYFSKHYKLIAIDFSKQIELENPGLKQQINFIERLERNEGVAMFFIIEMSEETTFKLINIFQPLILTMYKNGNSRNCEFMIVNLQNLQQENGMLSMIKIKQTMVKEMKMVQPLNLKPSH